MKLQYLLQGLCLIKAIQAQTAKDDFDTVCDSQNGEEFSAGDGTKFTYVCRMTGKGGPNIIDTLEDVMTSTACANSCAADDECKGSSWDYSFKSCVLYRDSGDLKSRNKGLFLQRVEVSTADCSALEEKLEACEFERDLFESQGGCDTETSQIEHPNGELEICKAESLTNSIDLHICRENAASSAINLQHCEDSADAGGIELQKCQNDAATNALELQQCKNSGATSALQLQQCQNLVTSTASQLTQCQTTSTTCASELQKCKAAASSSTGLPVFADCTAGGNGQVLRVGNRNFKQRCNALMWKNQMPLRRVIKPGLNQLECAMICSLDSGCQTAYFVRTSATVGECQLQNQNIESRLGNGGDIAYIPV
ncbi:hypothetical protein N7454_006631 [Penicillium verhagenii]|nr:hypothetical protein N7454_006631 [Penicillium verhagenii]